MDIVKALTSLLNTLNLISVSGEDDLDRMLASIRMLRSMISSLAKEEIEKSQKGGNE